MNFDQELTAFRARTVGSDYDALILLGTRQATTAALLIGTLNVQKVAFLLTPETRNLPDDVAALLGVIPASWLCPDGDHSTTTAVYRGLRQVIDALPDIDRGRIAVDVTGGLKPMSVGVEKAAHILGLQTIYIQSDYHTLLDGRSVPTPGTQKLVVPPDPYVVFGDLEAREARRLYDAHDYQGAQRTFDTLARRVPGEEGERYRACAALADAYTAWDAFDLPAAERMLDAILATRVGALPGDTQTRLEQQLYGLQALNALGRQLHGRGGPPLRALQNLDLILALFGSLHANALRREQQGRLDVAALLRYRCLELMSQHRLAQYGIVSERVFWNDVRRQHPDVSERYQAVEERMGFEPRGLPRGDNLSLFNGYMLLEAIGDELTTKLELKRVQQQVRIRNTSILAHGYRLITDAEYRPFAALVDDVRARFFVLAGRNMNVWEMTYQFVSLWA